MPVNTSTMTESNDKPPVISLAAKRKESERDFGAERELLTKELLAIGQSREQAGAIVNDMLLLDWYVPQAVTILERWDLEQDAQAAVELVKIMVASEK